MTDGTRHDTRVLGQRHDTLVVGAGIAGLAYAHARGPDADLLLLEAGPRPGGLVWTEQRDGCHFEWGPETLQDGAAETDALLAELGLTPSFAPDSAARRYLLRPPDRLVALPGGPGGLLTTPLLSPGAKLSLVAGLFRKRRDDLDGSLADFVRSRFGAQVLERLADPAISGVWAGDPERLSLQAAVPRLHAMLVEHGSLFAGMRAKGRARRAERAAAGEAAAPRRKGGPRLFSMPGGLQTLTDSLGAALGPRLRTSCPVATLAPDRDGWTVTTAAGERLAARRLVLALPAAGAAALTAVSLPELSAVVGAQPCESVAVVIHCWRRQDVGHPIDGFGYLVSSALGREHLGTLFSSAIQPERCPPDQVLLRTLVGGARRPDLLERDDDSLVEGVIQQSQGPLALAPGSAPLFAAVQRRRDALPRYDLDQPHRLATIDSMLAELPGLSLIGNHRCGLAVNGLIEASRRLAREHAAAGPLDA